MNSTTLIVVLLVAISSTIATYSDQNSLHMDLMKRIFLRYISPHNLSVTFGVDVQCGGYCDSSMRFCTSVLERYAWSDNRLSFEPSQYGGVDVVTVYAGFLWLPDFRLFYSSNPMVVRGKVKVVVTSEGRVTWVVPVLYENFCPKIGDKIHCSYKVGSWAYSDEDMELKLHELGVRSDYHRELCPYSFEVKDVELQSQKYPSSANNYTSLIFKVEYDLA